MNKMTAVTLDSVTKRYGSLTAVNNISLDIHPGEVVAFLGPNGAGKSTTSDMLLGLTKPSSGEITVFGMDPNLAIRHGITGAIMQSGGFLPDMTIGKIVQYAAAAYAYSIGAATALEEAGITKIASRKIGKCSGGEIQRLRFALALLPNPYLLILDEPTAGMDTRARHDFWTTMQTSAAAGRTIIFATHYLEEADAYAQRVILINSGSIIADGPTSTIRSLVSGRTLSVTIPPKKHQVVTTKLKSIPHTLHNLAWNGDRLTVDTDDSDALSRFVLGDIGGYDLEITSPGLEQAFVQLTDKSDRANADATDRLSSPDVPAKTIPAGKTGPKNQTTTTVKGEV